MSSDLSLVLEKFGIFRRVIQTQKDEWKVSRLLKEEWYGGVKNSDLLNIGIVMNTTELTTELYIRYIVVKSN